MPKETLVKLTKYLIDRGANARTIGILIGALSPTFVKENCAVPRQNISEFVNSFAKEIGPKNSPVLDLGCGRRSHKQAFIENLPYIALDHYVGKDKEYKNHGPNVFGDVANVPIKDSSIGTVLCTEVLEHVPDDDKVLSEVYRVLKPLGKVLLSVPGKHIPKHEKLPFQKDYRRFQMKDLEQKLLQHGFNDISIIEKQLYKMQINIFITMEKHEQTP